VAVIVEIKSRYDGDMRLATVPGHRQHLSGVCLPQKLRSAILVHLRAVGINCPLASSRKHATTTKNGLASAREARGLHGSSRLSLARPDFCRGIWTISRMPSRCSAGGSWNARHDLDGAFAKGFDPRAGLADQIILKGLSPDPALAPFIRRAKPRHLRFSAR